MDNLPFIAWCLDNLNYFTIAFLMLVESSFIPFPSEIVIPPAAYLAATSGQMSLPGVIASGTIGAALGALVNYYLALWLGRPLVYRFVRSRLGAMCLLDETKVAKAEAFFYKHGSVSTFVGRLLPGIRQLISLPAGLARMHLPRFVLYTTLGAGVWNIVLALLGYYLASVVPQHELNAYVSKYSHEIGYALLGIVALALGFIIYRGVRKPERPYDTPNV